MLVVRARKRESREIRFRVLERSETSYRTIFRDSGLLERVVMAFIFAASVGNMAAHCLVRSFEFMIAASKVP